MPLHEIEWWIPTERPAFTMWTPDYGFEQGDMLSADEVICDQCDASIEFTPVPVISGNALCPDCFQKMFNISIEEAAHRAGVAITYKEEVDE